MANVKKSVPGRSGGIDPAALAAASLAVAISAIAPPGPYNPPSVMIGATILTLILSYDEEPHREKWESVAFGAVCALVTLLAIGYPLELICAKDKAARFAALLRENPNDLNYSEIPPWAVLFVWLVMTAAYTWHDRRRSSNASADTPSGTSATSEKASN